MENSTYKKQAGRVRQLALMALLSASAFTHAQNITATRPETASMLHGGENPGSLFTGIPDIAIPLYSLPTHSPDVSIDFGLSYHPSGLCQLDKEGDMGRGWNLSAEGVISRSVIMRPDEIYSNINGVDQYDSLFDVYQFSFLGKSGRFRIRKDFQNNTFSVQMMDNSTMKIEYAFNSQNKSIDSFTLFDEKGIRYVFDVYDVNVSRFQSIGNVVFETAMAYRSSHYLSRIYDNNGKELASYQYSTRTVDHMQGNVYFATKVYNRLEGIVANGVGKALISHLDPTASKINGISIKRPTGESIVKKFEFVYAPGNSSLSKVRDYSTDLLQSRDYSISYNIRGLPAKDTENKYEYPVSGWLEKIVSPSGGSTLYEFEWNTYSFQDNAGNESVYLTHNPDNEIVLEWYGGDDFDTSISRTLPLQVTGTATKKLRFDFWHEPYNFPPNQQASEDPLAIRYKLMSGTSTIHDFGFNPEGGFVEVAPGNYTIAVITVANLNTYGNISITHEASKNPLKKWLYAGGLRIRRIATFDHDANQSYLYSPSTFPDTPAMETYYNYQRFNEPLKSSGAYFEGLVVSWEPAKVATFVVGYENVKVSQYPENGHTKYTFAKQEDYDAVTALDNVNSIMKGVLKKTEVFDISGNPVSKTENSHNLVASGDYFPANPTYEAYSYDTRVFLGQAFGGHQRKLPLWGKYREHEGIHVQ